MKRKNQIFEVFGIKGNAEKVPVNHVMKSVRPDLLGRTCRLSIVPHTVATIVKIFFHAGLILFVCERDAHDGSAFLAMDDSGEGQMIVRIWREARGPGHEPLNMGKKVFGDDGGVTSRMNFFLMDDLPRVDLVPQHVPNGRITKRVSLAGNDALLLQCPQDGPDGPGFNVAFKNELDLFVSWRVKG